MSSNTPEHRLEDGTPEQDHQSDALLQHTQQPQYVMPASIQLENAFVVEIAAKKYPVEGQIDLRTLVTKIGIEEIQLSPDKVRAQAILSAQIGFNEEPKAFEISFKIVGLFTCTQNMPTEAIELFLKQGSLGVLLPFARELLISLCMRLQVPPIMLQMIQLTAPPSSEEGKKEEVQESSFDE